MTKLTFGSVASVTRTEEKGFAVFPLPFIRTVVCLLFTVVGLGVVVVVVLVVVVVIKGVIGCVVVDIALSSAKAMI